MKFSSCFLNLAKLILFAAIFTLPTTAFGEDVGNFLDCVRDNHNGDLTAFFGYTNRSLSNESLTPGTALNQFIPLPSNRFQPSTFLPGTHHFVFSVDFPSGTQLTWLLNNSATVADNNSPVCQDQSFTYQGRLTDRSASANGVYQMQFTLFDAATGGNQIGSTVANNNVVVTAGIFNVPINVISATAFDGSDRYLDVQVKRPADASYTALTPRQKIAPTPYALHSISADTAQTAANAALFSMRTVNDFVFSSDPRLSDSRTPTAGSSNYIQNTTTQQAANFNISGSGTIGSNLSVAGNQTIVGNLTVNGSLNAASSPTFILNSTTQQAASNFNISGDGTIGGKITATQYNIGNSPVLSIGDPVLLNTFTGVGAGSASPTGSGNSFYGFTAGQTTITGSFNSFFGQESGLSNSTGSNNVFLGAAAGRQNTAADNTFVGTEAGRFNTSGTSNTFLGRNVGRANTSGSSNTLIGSFANVASGDLSNATAIGTQALVSTNNSLVLGSISGVNGALASTNVGIGTTSPNFALHIRADGQNGIKIQHTGNGTFPQIRWTDSSDALKAAISVDTSATAQMLLFVDGSDRIKIDKTGVQILGTLSKAAGSFKIDHPLEPDKKYLYHSFVESPDMKNIYDGVVVLDRRGQAVVTLPDWFEA
ncbi:MAG TPA: hypothetical protein VFC63_12620, partial [Blastocatellia bacterium]|nr:hypothetical protein [Blastocatellia bacterium]